MSNQSAVPVETIAPSLVNASSLMVASVLQSIVFVVQCFFDGLYGQVSWIGNETWHWIIAVFLTIILIFRSHNYVFGSRQLGSLTLYRQSMVSFQFCSHYIAVWWDCTVQATGSFWKFLVNLALGVFGVTVAFFWCLVSTPSKSEIDEAGKKTKFEQDAADLIKCGDKIRAGHHEMSNNERKRLVEAFQTIGQSSAPFSFSGANGGMSNIRHENVVPAAAEHGQYVFVPPSTHFPVCPASHSRLHYPPQHETFYFRGGSANYAAEPVPPRTSNVPADITGGASNVSGAQQVDILKMAERMDEIMQEFKAFKNAQGLRVPVAGDVPHENHDHLGRKKKQVGTDSAGSSSE